MKKDMIPDDCRMVLIEGINGAGKSTLSRYLLNEGKTKKESLISYRNQWIHPIDLQRMACMNERQYEDFLLFCRKQYFHKNNEWDRFISDVEKNTFYFAEKRWIAYLAILSPDYHKEAVCLAHENEIYDGKANYETFRYFQLKRWRDFVDGVNVNNVHLLEAIFLQYPLMEMLGFYGLDDKMIMEFYRELIDIILPLKPQLFYLDVPNVAKTIENITRERVYQGKKWIDNYLSWFNNTRFALVHNVSGIDGVVCFCKERQRIEHMIINHFKELRCKVICREDLK